jgi:regulator of nucleoside diphosphate kinase
LKRHDHLFLTQLDAIRLRTLARQLLIRRGAARADGERLLQQLDSAPVVPPSVVPEDVVTMNSALVYEELATGETAAVTLVYPEEADPAAGRISVLSDVGWTLLGLRPGNAAQVDAPGWRKPRGIRVLKVTFQPEAAGQWML